MFNHDKNQHRSSANLMRLKRSGGGRAPRLNDDSKNCETFADSSGLEAGEWQMAPHLIQAYQSYKEDRKREEQKPHHPSRRSLHPPSSVVPKVSPADSRNGGGGGGAIAGPSAAGANARKKSHNAQERPGTTITPATGTNGSGVRGPNPPSSEYNNSNSQQFSEGQPAPKKIVVAPCHSQRGFMTTRARAQAEAISLGPPPGVSNPPHQELLQANAAARRCKTPSAADTTMLFSPTYSVHGCGSARRVPCRTLRPLVKIDKLGAMQGTRPYPVNWLTEFDAVFYHPGSWMSEREMNIVLHQQASQMARVQRLFTRSLLDSENETNQKSPLEDGSGASTGMGCLLSERVREELRNSNFRYTANSPYAQWKRLLTRLDIGLGMLDCLSSDFPKKHIEEVLEGLHIATTGIGGDDADRDEAPVTLISLLSRNRGKRLVIDAWLIFLTHEHHTFSWDITDTILRSGGNPNSVLNRALHPLGKNEGLLPAVHVFLQKRIDCNADVEFVKKTQEVCGNLLASTQGDVYWVRLGALLFISLAEAILRPPADSLILSRFIESYLGGFTDPKLSPDADNGTCTCTCGCTCNTSSTVTSMILHALLLLSLRSKGRVIEQFTQREKEAYNQLMKIAVRIATQETIGSTSKDSRGAAATVLFVAIKNASTDTNASAELREVIADALKGTSMTPEMFIIDLWAHNPA